MVRGSFGAVVSLMLMVLLSVESHSMMVRIFRSHGAGGRWRCVSRAFFRWWKSPSVRVYLEENHNGLHQRLIPEGWSLWRRHSWTVPAGFVLSRLLFVKCRFVEGDSASGQPGGDESLRLAIVTAGGRQSVRFIQVNGDL